MGLVNSCCCGCSLSQGTIGTGIISVGRGIILIAVGSYYLSSYDVNEYNDVQMGRLSTDGNTTIYWGLIAEGIISIFVSALLLLGVSMKRRGFLLPWMALTTIGFGLGVPTLIYQIVSVQINPVQFIVGLIMLSLMVYLYIVVYSYYKQLQNPIFSQSFPIEGASSASGYNYPGFVIRPPQNESAAYISLPNNYKQPPPSYASEGPYFEGYPSPQLPPPPSYTEAVHGQQQK